MTHNITGINFYKPQTSNNNTKNLLVTSTNQANDNNMRSSSAFDQKRFNLHSSPNSKHRTPFNNAEEKNTKRAYDFIPKLAKTSKTVILDPVYLNLNKG